MSCCSGNNVPFRVVKDRKIDDLQVDDMNTVPVGDIILHTPIIGMMMLNRADLTLYYADGTAWFPLCCQQVG